MKKLQFVIEFRNIADSEVVYTHPSTWGNSWRRCHPQRLAGLWRRKSKKGKKVRKNRKNNISEGLRRIRRKLLTALIPQASQEGMQVYGKVMSNAQDSQRGIPPLLQDLWIHEL